MFPRILMAILCVLCCMPTASAEEITAYSPTISLMDHVQKEADPEVMVPDAPQSEAVMFFAEASSFEAMEIVLLDCYIMSTYNFDDEYHELHWCNSSLSLEYNAKDDFYFIPKGQLYSGTLQTDYFEFPNQAAIECGPEDYSLWGWFDTHGDYPEDTSYVMNNLRNISDNGELSEFIPYDGAFLLICKKEPVERFAVAYYNPDGSTADYSQELFAFPNSKLFHPPSGVTFTMPDGSTPTQFVVKDTGAAPPFPVTGPVKLQPVATKSHTVTFLDGAFTCTLTVADGDPIDWSLAPVRPDTARGVFAGWSETEDGPLFANETPVVQDTLLYAQYTKPFTVSFWADDGSTLHLAMSALPQSTINLDQDVGIPACNRPFTGWIDQAGQPFTDQTVITGNTDVYAQYDPWTATASFHVLTTCHIASFDKDPGWQNAKVMLAQAPVLYDEALDMYYVMPAPERLVFSDAFRNEVQLGSGTQPWGWAYGDAPQGGFVIQGDRWYFGGGFRHDHVAGGQVSILYPDVVTLYRIYLMDENGALLGNPLELLKGGTLSYLMSSSYRVETLPAQKRASFLGWTLTENGKELALSSVKVDRPLTVRAKYKPLLDVSFYVEGTVHHVAQVAQDTTLHFSSIPRPSQEDMLFLGWRQMGSIHLGTLPLTDSVVVQTPMIFQAVFEPLYRIEVVNAAGKVIWSDKLQEGALLNLDKLPQEDAAGRAFLYWEDQHGNALSGLVPVTGRMHLRAVYEPAHSAAGTQDDAAGHAASLGSF